MQMHSDMCLFLCHFAEFCSSQPEFFPGLIPKEMVSGGWVSLGSCACWPPNNLLLKDFTWINEIQEMLRNHFEMNNTETIPRGIIWDALKVMVREYICLTVRFKEIKDQNRCTSEKEIKKWAVHHSCSQIPNDAFRKLFRGKVMHF